EAGITNTNFVSSNKAPDYGFPYDGENKGYTSFLITSIIRDNQLPGWLNAARPDIIIMHLGTNDINIIRVYSTLVDQIRASKPNIKILVNYLTRHKPDIYYKYIVLIILEGAPTKSTQASPIIIMDNFSGFNTITDTTDGKHPNNKGN
ncbi:carbohydrate esterase family 3 protein, partial [Zopfia rhizophila CBS 207.26]